MAVPIAGVLAGSDPWKILPEEWAKYEAQFVQLNPAQGVVTGDQAKKFFLQSQLPGSVLGQIWSIADTNSDGKMDKNEFAIAMKLVQMKLKGFEVPKLLPPSLKVVAAAVMGGFHPPPMGMGGSQASGIPSAAFPPTSQFGPSAVSNGSTFAPQPVPATGVVPPGQSVASSSLISAGPSSPVDAMMQRSSSVTSQDSPTGSVSSPLQEWAIPHQSKLKYTQLFNTNDRMRSGFLTGPQARHILVQTGLPQPVLAQIWALSDINGDGRLSCEEFCVALHLADSVKAGDKLPTALPSDLVPPSFRKRRSSSVTSGGPLPTNGGAAVPSQPLNPAPVLLSDLIAQERKAEELKNALMTTFEDKRKENFEKGQAELERRRQALLESQRKEREERERKEREEQERKERIRQEQERRRQIELEKQLAKQREIEQEKEEQRRKAMEQREAARREMERQRQLEWEKQRRQELLGQRQKEQEKVLQLKAQNQNLGIELEQLNEKTKDLNQRIIDTRGGVADIKNTIDQMRVTRDAKVNELDLLKKSIKEQNLALIQLNHEKAQLDDRIQVNNVNNPTADSFNMVTHSFSSKQITLKNLKDKLSSTESDVAQKLLDIGNNNSQLKELKEKVQQMLTDADRLHRTYEDKKTAALALRQKKGVVEQPQPQPQPATAFGREWEKDAWPADTSAAEWPAADAAALPDSWSNEWPLATQNADVVKYRALYGFDARNPDELAIMPGDVVTVFLGQNTEPGWLSGELKGKTGWFPEAYVERMDGAENGGVQENENAGSLTGVQETVHIVGTEMKMTLSGIQEAPESISDNGSIGGEMAASEGPPPSAFIQVPKSGAPGTASPVQGQGQFVEGLQAQALFPWRAKKENHLTFNKSDVITIKEQQDIWWFGELEERQGWFPKSYVRLISGPKRLADQGSRSQTPMSDTSSQAELTNVPDLAGGTAAADAEPDYYIATFPYQSAETGDLTFGRGDVIEVTRMDGDWWSGTMGERSGIFPCNYVKKVDDVQEGDVDLPEEPPPEPDEEAPIGLLTQTKGGKKPDIATVIAPYMATGPEQLSLQRGQLLSVRKKNESGWWEGELHAKGKKRQVGWFPASYVKMLSMSSGDLSARSTPEPILTKEDGGSPPTARAPQEKVVALYPYDAQNEDELTFAKGAVIDVVSREDVAWWKGEYGGVVGVFPSNYVQTWDGGSAEANALSSSMASLPPAERKRQEHIRELIATEETYMEDMSIVLDAFCKPLREAKILSELELDTIFVNWNELINCNTKLLKAFRVRRKMSPNDTIQMIGDILCENLPSLSPYIRFCSCQLNAAAIIQSKTENSQEFRDITKKCCMDQRTKGMPISSFLLKPMQRITRYPLLIKKILEHTGESHPDRANLTDALSRSEELCMQVNEGVREKENSDRLEFVQRTVNCDGVIEKITFNSLTNSLGPRKFLHSGSLIKIKSGKELTAFLFNDFLLLTQPYKNYGSVSSLFNLEKIANAQFKMYKKPMFLHSLEIKKLSESGEDTTNFMFVHDGHSFSFKAPTVNERNTWIRKLQSAAAHYRDVESKKNIRNMSLQKQQRPALGRLLVAVLEAVDLRAKANVRRSPPVGALRVVIVEAANLMCFKLKGRSDPYCEVNMGSQEQRTKVVNDTVNPKWNASMQFHVKDPKEDVLCITVFDRDYFSPNDFLGRTEIRIAEIIRETRQTMGPVIMKKPLHEVDTGEIVVKLDIQLFS